jgi:hypothetical protein
MCEPTGILQSILFLLSQQILPDLTIWIPGKVGIIIYDHYIYRAHGRK